ncbi:glycogen-binding domain-containing protein [Opitutus terrae]|nr:glycogen-binding domain-containing protein [Opitutus terrae]
MKKKKKPTNLARGLFTYLDPLATTVFVAGSFNDWKPDAAAMIQVIPGRWELEVSLPPGRHEYLFVVDGKWVVDPTAKETCPNPYGGLNAVAQA